MTATTYEPALAGGALALVAGPRALVLPTSVEPERREQLGAALAESGVQAVLDLLAAGGLALVPPFALIDAHDPELMHIVVRGGFEAGVETSAGTERVTGEAVSTWVERVIHGATGVTVTVAGATAGAHGALPLASGTVLAASVRVAVAATVPGPEPITDVEATMVEAPSTAPGADAAPQPAAETAAEPARAQSEQAPESEGYDYLFGETMFRGVAEAAVRAEESSEEQESSEEHDLLAEPEPAEAEGQHAEVDVFTTGGDHDGHTVLTGDIAKLRASRAGASAAAATPPPPPAAPEIALVFSTGPRETLTQPVLVGRSPSITKVSGTRMPRLVTVGGVDQDISRNHAQFALEGGTVVVTDLHSRNGTMIAMPGRDPQKLRAGEPTSVLVGTVVDLGSGITITVEYA